MNKKLMALAVGSVLAAPAVMAQTSTVTLYGRANLGLDNYQATGATNPNLDYKSRMRVYDTGSRIGVRGIEDLGGGLRAVFQIESGLNADTGNTLNQGGGQNFSAGLLASRPSWVGLDGAFGRVLWGRQDVWWGNGTINQAAATYVNSETPWQTGNGRLGVGVSRQSNVFSYTTPTFGGFNASAYWSPDTAAAGIPSSPGNTAAGTVFTNNEVTNASKSPNARLLGLTARWAGGPIALQYDGVQKKTASDQFVGGTPQNTAHKVGVGFTYAPGGQISLIATNTRLKDNIGTGFVAGAALKQNTFTLDWEHVFGNIQALAQFAIAQKVTGCGAGAAFAGTAAGTTLCDDSSARAFMVGAKYLASKRTGIYLTYNQLTNKANSYADYSGGGYSSGPLSATTAGADPRIIALGVIHNF